MNSRRNYHGRRVNHRGDDKPKASRFDAKATREYINDIFTTSEIEYLVQSSIDKGNNLEKLSKDSKFRSLWDVISPEDGLTPSRICHAVPEVTCKYLQSCPKHPISLQACIDSSGYPQFPTIARHSACASLIPESFNFRVEALEVIMLANMLFCEKIQTPELAELLPKDKFKHNFNFVKKSFHSPVLVESERWELSCQFGIVTEDCSLTEEWMAAADAAGKWLQKTYQCGILISGTEGDVESTD